jgi:hypothetical protein
VTNALAYFTKLKRCLLFIENIGSLIFSWILVYPILLLFFVQTDIFYNFIINFIKNYIILQCHTIKSMSHIFSLG